MRNLLTVLTLLGAAAAYAGVAVPADDSQSYRMEPYHGSRPPDAHAAKAIYKYQKEQRKLYERDRKAMMKMAEKSSLERSHRNSSRHEDKTPYSFPRQ